MKSNSRTPRDAATHSVARKPERLFTPRSAVDRVTSIAAEVIAKASHERPADSALRDVLKNAKAVSADEARAISHAVFAYFRWLGWLDPRRAIPEQLRRALDLADAFQRAPHKFTAVELQRAIPEWTKDCLTVSDDWLRSLQATPHLWLRARVGQGIPLAKRLGDCRPAAPGQLADVVCYEGDLDLFRTPKFHAGEFEVQDIASQFVGLVCDPKPGETWWDACAGEGGKLLHLSDLMQNKGLIWASDRAEWRLQKLKRRTARAGVFNYRAVPWDGGAKLPTKIKFDGILVDAPCSGIGTWQRNPHARWTTTPDDVRELAEVQVRLLSHAIPALKPGGRLIYSVCTLANAETSDVLAAIGKRFPQLESLQFKNPLDLLEQPMTALWLWPQDIHGNGMFICGWRMAPLKESKEQAAA